MCPDINNLYELKVNSIAGSKFSNSFRRAGTMAAALVLKVGDQSEQFEDTISIYAEASNGQMPNLDLINVVNYLAVHRQGLRVKVEKLWSLLNSSWLRNLGEIFESLGKLAKSLNPEWKFGIPATEYVEGTATLASSLYYQVEYCSYLVISDFIGCFPPFLVHICHNSTSNRIKWMKK